MENLPEDKKSVKDRMNQEGSYYRELYLIRYADDYSTQIEEKLMAKAQAAGEEAPGEVVLALMAEADREAKEILAWIFGDHNDFDAIFCGVNVMSVASNGERIITNFIHAVQPILEAGAKKCSKQQVNDALNKARKNRAQRRAEARQK